MPTTQQARTWLDRWDRQQEYYMPDREERFAVIADIVAESAGREDPLIVDLGAGPGSLSVRLLDRLPSATVVAVDADPLLLGLASAAFDDRPGLRVVRQDLREPGWVDGLGLDRAVNAVVSTTALHWLTRPQLAGLYRRCGELVEPGGVFVNGDHLHEGPGRPRLDVLTRRIAKARSARVDLERTEDWDQWWDAVDAAPELADLRAESGARPVEHSAADIPSYEDHVRYLQAAGFAEVGTVWQHGDDRVLVAVR